MKIMKLIIPVFILLLFPIYSYPATFGYLRVSLIEGDIQTKTEDTDDWVPASINMPLREGDRIWVPEGGRAELQLIDGTLLRLGEQSALEILTLQADSSQFYLNEGHIYANFRGLKENLLQIDTPVSSVRAYDRSIFKTDASEGYIDISVFEGSVYAETKDGTTRVGSNKTLSLGEGDYAELSPLGPADEWEEWNRARDRKYAEQRPPSRYLPDELSGYSSDLEENGRWIHTPEYGYVWTPTVVVSAGWAPYRVGRWVWMGGDYVWISYEPWGWVPYHYGRWVFIGSRGWCWVPPARGAVYWGPGFVGWVRTPTYVSWVPLAPGEIYYGRGYYGPHSVNITKVNIANIHVEKVVYKNVHVHNGVTIIHHDTFVTGKRMDVKVRENPFLQHRISIGGPNIKPERATIMPVIREIPHAKRPPELVREIKVKELKESRPLVRSKESSVLRPGAPPKEMPVKPVERKRVERPTGIEKPKPFEKGAEKPREFKPAERELEKPKGYKPAEKPLEFKPPEKLERPKPIEKGMDKPKDYKPPQKLQEFKPPEREVEKPKDYQPAEKPREFKPSEKLERPKPIEKGIDKPKDYKPAEKAREFKPPEKGIEKPKPIEKGIDKPRESKPPERGLEKPKGTERAREPKPVEKPIEKTKEHKPAEKGIGKPE